MESLNPLEKLNFLEQKIASLVEVLNCEKEANKKLIQEKEELKSRLEAVENSLLKETQIIEDLNQERVITKMVVDELIGNIDRLVDVKQEEL